MKRVDSNQKLIFRAVRDLGFSAESTAMVGNGFPDAVISGPLPCPHCGVRIKQNLLVEIKDGNRSPSQRKLTVAERQFHESWRGPIVVIKSVDEALEVLGV